MISFGIIERMCSVYVQVNFREFLQLILDGYFLNGRMDLERRFKLWNFWNVFLEIDESIREIERLDSDTFVKIALIYCGAYNDESILHFCYSIEYIYDLYTMLREVMSRYFVDVYLLKNLASISYQLFVPIYTCSSF